jgi:hypothetical protein
MDKNVIFLFLYGPGYDERVKKMEVSAKIRNGHLPNASEKKHRSSKLSRQYGQAVRLFNTHHNMRMYAGMEAYLHFGA